MLRNFGKGFVSHILMRADGEDGDGAAEAGVPPRGHPRHQLRPCAAADEQRPLGHQGNHVTAQLLHRHTAEGGGRPVILASSLSFSSPST